MMDIVDRLLESGEFNGFSDAAEAAEEIQSLRAEVEALRKMLLQAADEVHDLGYDGSHYREAALAAGRE